MVDYHVPPLGGDIGVERSHCCVWEAGRPLKKILKDKKEQSLFLNTDGIVGEILNTYIYVAGVALCVK